MNKKAITIIIPIFIGVIILGGLLYFVSLFWKGDSKKEASLDDFKNKSEIFSSKKEAYDRFISDSVVKVRQENVSPKLGSLFTSKKEENKELIPTQEPSSEKAIEPVKQTPVAVKHSIRRNQVVYRPPVTTGLQSSWTQPQPPAKQEATQQAKEIKRFRTGFNSVSSDNPSPASNKSVTIHAVIHSKQTVYQGATVKLRATQSFLLNGVAVPENTLIYGAVAINNERVTITVNSLNLNGSIIPVSLHAYDRDGMEGVYIPGLVQHDIKNESVDQAITEAQSALNIPHVGDGAINVIRNRNRQTTAILTDSYELTLK
jgi:FtsZ-interacting cell division protein ZipA